MTLKRLLPYLALVIVALLGFGALKRWASNVAVENARLDASTDAALLVGRAWRAERIVHDSILRADSIRIDSITRTAARRARTAQEASGEADRLGVELTKATTAAESLTVVLAQHRADSTGSANWKAAYMDQIAATAVLTADLGQAKLDLATARSALFSSDSALTAEREARHDRNCLLGWCPSGTTLFLAGAAAGAVVTVVPIVVATARR